MSHMAQPSPSFSNWTASSNSPMLNEKDRFQETVYQPIDSSNSVPVQGHVTRTHTNLARAEKLLHYSNGFGYTVKIISVGLTAVMDAIMVYVLYKFYTTKSIPAPGRVSPWAKNTQLWPAFVLLTSSFITLLIDLAGLLAYCCHKKSRVAKMENKITLLGYVFFAVKWIIVFILYRIGKTSKDLWGWSCDKRAANIQKYYLAELNFSRMCTEQTVAWYLSIAEMGLKAILLVAVFSMRHKLKKLHKAAGQ